MIELVIFDVDGTLAEAYTLNLLPRVKDFFQLVFQAGCPERPKVALATNQGGVGMRHWMEKGRFGKPEEYPTREDIEQRLKSLIAKLGGDRSIPVYVSYRYQTRQGKWAPIPHGEGENPRWQEKWRKPQPGMLLQAMEDAGVAPHRTLFVGDNRDDQEAAQAAGCDFQWASDFFALEWSDCDRLANLVSEN